MAELEPPADPPESEGGGGIGSFLNSTRGIISSVTALVVAVSGLLIALNRVGVLGGDDDDPTPKTETTKPAGLFGAMTRPIGRVYFDGTTMFVRAAQPRRPLLHLADLEEALGDVAMTSRVTWLSGGRDYGVGFICRYDSRADYYLLAVLSGGRYNIVRYRDGTPRSLTGGIQQSSDVTGDTNEITARCVGNDPTTLTLEVNGRTVATEQDPDGIENGNVGIRAGSGESFVTFRFENFELRYL